MKIEIGTTIPSHFKSSYPEEFELFSHFETTSGIPTVLFAVTTWKENGKPNVCFHAWSCFHGDKTAFFAVMGGLYQHTHTYANIQREACFGINFLPVSCYDRLINTIRGNEYEADEFQAGGFTVQDAKTIHAPHDSGGLHQYGVYAERHSGFKRRRDYSDGDRPGSAYICRGGVCAGL